MIDGFFLTFLTIAWALSFNTLLPSPKSRTANRLSNYLPCDYGNFCYTGALLDENFHYVCPVVFLCTQDGFIEQVVRGNNHLSRCENGTIYSIFNKTDLLCQTLMLPNAVSYENSFTYTISHPI